jgi:hypothetical protein
MILVGSGSTTVRTRLASESALWAGTSGTTSAGEFWSPLLLVSACTTVPTAPAEAKYAVREARSWVPGEHSEVGDEPGLY